jgi:c-di-GMP-binding flagellar brake protein YcgR
VEESRKDKRLSFNLDVVYDISRHQRWTNSRSKDLSEGGICLITGEAVPVDTEIELRFYTPDSNRPVFIGGKVVWNGKFSDGKNSLYENGIRFLDIEESEIGFIKKFIENATFDA